MATINANTAITVPAGSLLKFAPGGQGRAVDPDGNSYTLGLSDVRCGPYTVAKTFQIIVTVGPIKYAVDADGSADDTMRVNDIESTMLPSPASAAAVRGAQTLVSGEWVWVPSISRLRVVGTGALSVDSRDRAGAVTLAVFTGSYSATTETIEFPYYGDSAVQIRATFPATLTVEVI